MWCRIELVEGNEAHFVIQVLYFFKCRIEPIYVELTFWFFIQNTMSWYKSTLHYITWPQSWEKYNSAQTHDQENFEIIYFVSRPLVIGVNQPSNYDNVFPQIGATKNWWEDSASLVPLHFQILEWDNSFYFLSSIDQDDYSNLEFIWATVNLPWGDIFSTWRCMFPTSRRVIHLWLWNHVSLCSNNSNLILKNESKTSVLIFLLLGLMARGYAPQKR